MNVDEFIEVATKHGVETGAAALGPLERAVFRLSELEVSCDVDGIDSFLDHYGPPEVNAVGELLAAAGATSIAAASPESLGTCRAATTPCSRR
jgi:hypothetical protein